MRNRLAQQPASPLAGSEPSPTRPFVRHPALFVFLLVGLNLLIFRRHYLGTDQFPWDFWKTYYAVVAFWTKLAHHGKIAQWVPFQYMGYPFFLNPQTGFFYPPLWFFALTGFTYSLHAAVIVQALHPLWGAIGVFLLVNVLCRDCAVAVFAGIAYQFFGGFYDNAEHVDIVRAYAWLPWLFWAATLRERLLLRNYLLPVVIFCAISGSYPGNIGSHLLFLGLYLVLDCWLHRYEFENIRPVLLLFVLAGIGVLLAAPVILPNVLLRHHLHHASANLPSNNWSFHNWLSLLVPWVLDRKAITGFTGDPSMVSAYVGVPVVVLVSLTSFCRRRTSVIWWILLLTASVLALGRSSFFYLAAVRIVPVLGLSRFPSSDYRGIIGLALIILAAISLHELQSRKAGFDERFRRRALLSLLIPMLVLSGIFEVALPWRELATMVGAWLLCVAILYYGIPRNRTANLLTTAAVVLITCIGGWHVLSVSSWTWTAGGTNLEALYRKSVGFTSNAAPINSGIDFTHHVTRKARVTRDRDDFAWAGYLDGSYQTGDYGNTELEAQYRIAHDPVLFAYMKLPLTPLIFDGLSEVTREMLAARLSEPSVSPAHLSSTVTVVSYGLNRIVYKMKLESPATIVVNEIWFPGWRGVATDRQGRQIAQVAVGNVGKAIRSWNCPAGDYRFETRFQTPYLAGALAISCCALLFYAAVVVVTVRNRRRLITLNDSTPVV